MTRGFTYVFSQFSQAGRMSARVKTPSRCKARRRVAWLMLEGCTDGWDVVWFAYTVCRCLARVREVRELVSRFSHPPVKRQGYTRGASCRQLPAPRLRAGQASRSDQQRQSGFLLAVVNQKADLQMRARVLFLHAGRCRWVIRLPRALPPSKCVS